VKNSVDPLRVSHLWCSFYLIAWFVRTLGLRGGFNQPNKYKSSNGNMDDEGQEANAAVFKDIARRYCVTWTWHVTSTDVCKHALSYLHMR
jgi:hypothetical protein